MTVSETYDKLTALIKEYIEVEGGPEFMGHPDRWYEEPGPKWRCVNDHVSTRYLGTDEGPRCLGCTYPRSPLWLTFPEDEDGPLEHLTSSETNSTLPIL